MRKRTMLIGGATGALMLLTSIAGATAALASTTTLNVAIPSGNTTTTLYRNWAQNTTACTNRQSNGLQSTTVTQINVPTAGTYRYTDEYSPADSIADSMIALYALGTYDPNSPGNCLYSADDVGENWHLAGTYTLVVALFDDVTIQASGMSALRFTGPGAVSLVEDPSPSKKDLTIWHQAYARDSGGAECRSHWNPSWALWPNDGHGGFVCVHDSYAFYPGEDIPG